jgi:hypothetical protein
MAWAPPSTRPEEWTHTSSYSACCAVVPSASRFEHCQGTISADVGTRRWMKSTQELQNLQSPS